MEGKTNIKFTLTNNKGIECKVVGTFRSTNCLRAAPKYAIKNNTCQECQKIPTFHSFKERLRLRVRKSQNSGDGNRSLHCIKNEYLTLKEKDFKLSKQQSVINSSNASSIFLLAQENLRMRLKLRTLKTRLADYAKRGEIKSICYQFQKAADEGKFTSKGVLKAFLETDAANFQRTSKFCLQMAENQQS